MAISTNIFNAKLTRGDTFVHRIVVKNTDETMHDLTGATARYTIRTQSYDGTQLLQKTIGNGIQLTAPTLGLLDVTLTAAETALFAPDIPLVYDCELTIAGQVQTVQTGSITVLRDVSVL